MTDTPYPYSSPEARSRAQDVIDAGRLSVHALPAKRQPAPTFPAIDELLFYVGQSREKLRLEIEAAHEQLPEALVSRRKGQTDERSIAQRLRLLLDLFDNRVSELLDANNREVERRRAAERNLNREKAENIANSLAALRFSSELAKYVDNQQMEHLWAKSQSSRDDLATPVIRSGLMAQFDAMDPEQERLAILFCNEIAGSRGTPASPPDPVRLLEMARALYEAEITAFLHMLTITEAAA